MGEFGQGELRNRRKVSSRIKYLILISSCKSSQSSHQSMPSRGTPAGRFASAEGLELSRRVERRVRAIAKAAERARAAGTP